MRFVGKEDGKKQTLPVTYCYNAAKDEYSWSLKGSPASLVTAKEVPVMVSKPRFNKKFHNASDTTLTVSNVIEPT